MLVSIFLWSMSILLWTNGGEHIRNVNQYRGNWSNFIMATHPHGLAMFLGGIISTHNTSLNVLNITIFDIE
jgi:hypothetical protein